MMAGRPEVWLECPAQAELDWLLRHGVTTAAMVRSTPILVAAGVRAGDGLFEPSGDGDRWFAFEQCDDFVFWNSRTNGLATYAGRAFALGEDIIGQASTYAFDCCLNIFANPIDWLVSNRDGIVVLPQNWPLAFERLRETPRIAISEQVLPTYRRHMRPQRMPQLYVLPERSRAA